MSFLLLFSLFCLDFLGAGVALCQTTTHFDHVCLPVNLQIVFTQPCVTENQVLFPKASDRKLCTLSVSLVPENYINNATDCSCLIKGAIDVVNQIGLSRFQTVNCFCFTYSMSMKRLVAPQSSSAFVARTSPVSCTLQSPTCPCGLRVDSTNLHRVRKESTWTPQTQSKKKCMESVWTLH
jgi:hypothetical protein